MTPWPLALVGWLLLAGTAFAHAGATGFTEVAVEGREVAVVLELPAYFLSDTFEPGGPPVEREDLVAVLPRLQASVERGLHLQDGPLEATATVEVEGGEKPSGAVTLAMRYVFPRPVRDLRLRHELWDPKLPSYRQLLTVHYQGETYETVLTPRRPAFRQTAGGLLNQLSSFVELGIEHIFTGYDHLAFLLGLLLLGGRWKGLVGIATAFTVAHSLTLIGAALGAFTLPGRLVELLIALSIAYVAAENLFLARTESPAPARWRWGLAFAFGLIHGFGFAGTLTELGLPTRHLVESLLAFNLGVELGQLAIIAAVFPLLLWSMRRPLHRRVVQAVSLVLLGLGLYWAATRLF